MAAGFLRPADTVVGMDVTRPWLMDAAGTPRSRARGRLRVLVAVVLLSVLAGCGAAVRPEPPTSFPPPAQVSVPADGITLKMIGFRNGPADAFTLPRSVVVVTSVDQASGVTLVFSNPSAADLVSFLRRTLPQTGFRVSQFDRATATLTFTGYGWHGSFTGVGDSSAVILRP